jgi:hypothetical protein
VVIEGWAKLAAPAAVNAGAGAAARLAASRFIVAVPPAGSALLHVGSAGDTLVFAETRSAAVWRRARRGQPDTEGTAVEATLREGDLWSQRPPEAAAGDGPAVGLDAVPRALADRLPRRAAHFEGRSVEASGGDALDPRELARWWRAEPALLGALGPRPAAWARTTRSKAAPAATSIPPGRRAAAAKAVPPARVQAGLAWPDADALPAAAPSIALEPTALLVSERLRTPLPGLASPTLTAVRPTADHRPRAQPRIPAP